MITYLIIGMLAGLAIGAILRVAWRVARNRAMRHRFHRLRIWSSSPPPKKSPPG